MFKEENRPLLVIDVGNTTIALGLFASPAASDLIKTGKFSSHTRPSPEELSRRILRFLGNAITRQGAHVAIGSVVPSLVRAISLATRPIAIKTLLVNSKCDFGFRLAVDVPAALGVDRIANAAAAWQLRKSPVAVADFGSATTISIMDGKAFRGGAILPGIAMMLDVLNRGTAKLPRVSLDRDVCAVGTNTSAAIRSGIVLGTAGAAEKIVATAERELGCRLSLFITGGNASFAIPFLRRRHQFVPDLTLQGFRLIFLRQLDLFA